MSEQDRREKAAEARLAAAMEEQARIAHQAVEVGKQARDILAAPVVREYFAFAYANALAFLRGCDRRDRETIDGLIAHLQATAALEKYLFGTVQSALAVAQKTTAEAYERGLGAQTLQGEDGFPIFPANVSRIATDQAIESGPDGEALEEYNKLMEET